MTEDANANTDIREQTIEEIAQFIEALQIHSWTLKIIAEKIRALSKQSQSRPDSCPRKSMGEVLVDPKEQEFWDKADRKCK